LTVTDERRSLALGLFACLECATGLGLILVPGSVIGLLFGLAHNQNTGTSADVNRNAAYNPETGNFDRSGSACASNPNGASASGQHNSQQNLYGGGSSGETTATVTNRAGQTNTYEAGHSGNNVYAGSDGNVYKNDGGGWQQNSNAGWKSMGNSFNSSDLDRSVQARSWGGGQFGSFSQRGFFGGNRFGGGGGWGGRGGWGGGGASADLAAAGKASKLRRIVRPG
jgi:hypothetical protein